MNPDPVPDLDRIKQIGDRFRQELLKGADGRYPELAETINRLRSARDDG